ncbi:MAG: helix-turn-helix transcriptional regulator [Planctomycetota bacterium JB042]
MTRSSAGPDSAVSTRLVEPLLTTKGVASILGVSPRTVWALLCSGAIRSVRIGERSVRVRPEDLRTYLARQAKGGRR